MGRCIFSFDRIAKLFCIGVVPRTVPKAVCATPGSPQAGQPGVLSHFQILAEVIEKKKCLTEFALPFSYHEVQHLCLRFRVIVILFCERFISFAHFSVGLFIFFLLIYGNIFYIRKISSLSTIEVADISPLFVICCFLFMSTFFSMQDFYIVEGINLFYDFLEFV